MGIKWIAFLFLQMALAVMGSRVQEIGGLYNQTKPIEVEENSDFPSRNVVKTIQSEDGDVIECIDIYKQPAFDHPALRNHKIQMAPTSKLTEEIPLEDEEGKRSGVTSQRWQKSGSCPDGTIPIRKMQNRNMRVRKEPQYYSPYHYPTTENKDVKLIYMNRSVSFLYTLAIEYYGGKGTFRVWNPPVEMDDEYSSARVAVISGQRFDYEIAEAGWAVNPRTYGDRQTRLFTYWTVDGSRKTGCFDLTCPGFVQTSKEIALGAALYPISTPNGLPYEITLFIHLDTNTKNLWVQYEDKIDLGYWPAEVFYLLNYHAQSVEWGGEVYSTKVGGVLPHTATGMGSGDFASIFGSSGVVRNIRVLDGGTLIKYPDYVYPHTDEFECYDYRYHTAYTDDPPFYFGGPGRNPICL